MRITAQAKQDTANAIRAAARKLFREKGLEKTSTRDLATAAGIAAGTLFNYFASKEALALALVADALDEGRAEAHAEIDRHPGTPEEDLFVLLAAAVRSLKPMHDYLGEVLEAGLSPLAHGALLPEAQRIREGHLQDVIAVLTRHGLGGAANAAVMHLYWALFLSVLAYWSADRSPTHEETRALIDQTVRMFVAPLRQAPIASVPHSSRPSSTGGRATRENQS